MLNKLFKHQGKENSAVNKNISSPEPVIEETYSAMSGIDVKWSDIPAYMKKRLLKLEKIYDNLMMMSDAGNDKYTRKRAFETIKRVLNERITEADRPELKYLLDDQSEIGLATALCYLSNEVLYALEKYKSTGELVDARIWAPGLLVINLNDHVLTPDFMDQIGDQLGRLNGVQ